MEKLLLIYSVALVIAVLMSERFQRSILSASVLFLLAGAATALPLFGPVELDPRGTMVSTVAEIALFSVLFTDGMALAFRELKTAMRLPGRALVFGLPLTMAGTAALAHWIARLPWVPAFLLGAILSPTDPVLVSAIIGRQGVPERLRRLLHIESGLNDGLALPCVLVFISMLGDGRENTWVVLTEVASGLGIGVIIPWLIVKLERTSVFGTTQAYTPLLPAAAAILAFSVCKLSHANEYLAAFTAGVTLATISPKIPDEFQGFGEPLTELIKLAALLLFGALLSPEFLEHVDAAGYVFAAAVLFLVRPAAIRFSLIRSGLPRIQIWSAGWFGPKGFASVTYSFLVLRSGIPYASEIFHLAGVTVAASVIAHSSSDVPIGAWLEKRSAQKAGPNPERRAA